MSTPLLATKLYSPPPRSGAVLRPHLIALLNDGLAAGRKLTLISAPAGFGKTTLVSEWIASCGRPVAWLSLDEGDSAPARFLTYVIAALQTLAANIGAGVLGVLESPQPPPIESVLTSLVNDIAAVPDSFVLVLDDYHVLEAKAGDASTSVDDALTFLLEHLPPQMHLVIATREDPDLPLARMRARNQLTELRAADLRFSPSEATQFLQQVMGLVISAADIAALETRTEGWIAGLQLAAISMRGHKDITSFVRSFTGSHQFVLDYLLEEALQQQPESIQTFLLRTSILNRMCGSLCDAVLHAPRAAGQATLEYLERVNLFIVPLDNERRWYRYHHLFADLLRQRLQQSDSVAEYHIRASQWYEDNGLHLEAFQHAAAANDIDRAERLIGASAMPLGTIAVATTVLDWLDSLPKAEMDARPRLWVRSASSAVMAGRVTGVEEKLQAAEKAIQHADPDDKTRDLIGQIASIRAVLAILRYQPEATIAQARRALEYMSPDNLPFRSRATWALGFAYHVQGDRVAARQAYTEAIAIARASGSAYYTVLTSTSLGQIQESDNQLHQAAETYRRSVQLLSQHGPPTVSEEHLGLARIFYEWNDLDAAEQHGQQSHQMALLYDRTIDRFLTCEVLLARLRLADGDMAGAAAMLALAEQSARQNNHFRRLPDIATAQVLTLLKQGDLEAAAQLAQTHDLPISRARVHLAQGDPAAALAVLEPWRRHVEAKGWVDEQLKAMVLLAVALRAHGEKDKAVHLLGEALALAEPGGCVRTFIDEGLPMAHLLSDAAARGVMPGYIGKLLAAFEAEEQRVPTGRQASPAVNQGVLYRPPAEPLIEPLTQRELEILRLIEQGLSNREIGERLFLALDTVKGHNRRVFDKLDVQTRTEAVARARELGLL